MKYTKRLLSRITMNLHFSNKTIFGNFQIMCEFVRLKLNFIYWMNLYAMILASYIGYHLVAKLNLQCRTSRTWSGKFLASFVDPKVWYSKQCYQVAKEMLDGNMLNCFERKWTNIKMTFNSSLLWNLEKVKNRTFVIGKRHSNCIVHNYLFLECWTDFDNFSRK